MSELLTTLREYGADVDGVMERFMDDEELLLTCIQEILAQNDIEALKNAVVSKEYDGAFEYAHALKGVTGNLGLTPLYDEICVLVESLRHKKLDHVDEEMEQVLKAWDTFYDKCLCIKDM